MVLRITAADPSDVMDELEILEEHIRSRVEACLNLLLHCYSVQLEDAEQEAIRNMHELLQMEAENNSAGGRADGCTRKGKKKSKKGGSKYVKGSLAVDRNDSLGGETEDGTDFDTFTCNCSTSRCP